MNAEAMNAAIDLAKKTGGKRSGWICWAIRGSEDYKPTWKIHTYKSAVGALS